MMWILIILLALSAFISVTLLILSRHEIRHITNDLKNISSMATNKMVLLSSPNKPLEELSQEINKVLKTKQQTEIKYKNMDKELRQSIANISHDLRTPLTSIIGYIDLIQDETLSVEEKNEYIEIIKKRANSLQILIAGFFDLSRLEANEYKLELKSIHLPNILCELIASFYNDFLNNNIEPIISIDEKAPEIIADENAVMRIFANLIQNILKHGKKFIEISLKQEKDCIVTSFTNDAPNLALEDIDHLFERFYIADKMRTGQSTGLGLAITKSLSEKMGATIKAELINGKLSIIINWRKKNS